MYITDIYLYMCEFYVHFSVYLRARLTSKGMVKYGIVFKRCDR